MYYIVFTGLTSCGIDATFLIGQGYDGALNMSGKYKGVQALVRKNYSQAIYVHCAAHYSTDILCQRYSI